MALVGAAAGLFVSAMFISSPMAYADPPPVPSPFDFLPPGQEGNPTIIEDSSVPYLYNLFQQNDPYSIFDQANHLVGDYDVKETAAVVGLLPLLGFNNDSEVVTDSTGAAPAIGTEWDQAALFSAPGGYPLALIADSSSSSPDGTSANLLEIPLADIGNYFSSGPTGLVDELSLFGTVVPIIDIPT
jgi:hypothetical protein